MKQKLLNAVRVVKEKVSNIDPEVVVIGVLTTVGTIAGMALASYYIGQRSEDETTIPEEYYESNFSDSDLGISED